MCSASGFEEIWPADDGHRFRISFSSASSTAVVGDAHHRDAEDWNDPQTVEVRAWSLKEALEEALKIPLMGWFPENDEETQDRCRAGCGRFIKKDGRCSQEIRVFREGTFVGWEHP